MICCSSALCARDAASSIASGDVANAAAAPPHYVCQVTALSWTAGTVLGRTHARSWTCSAAAQTNLSKSTATRTISDVDECQRRSAPARPQAIGGSMPACYEPDGSQPARPAPLQLRCTEQPIHFSAGRESFPDSRYCSVCAFRNFELHATAGCGGGHWCTRLLH